MLAVLDEVCLSAHLTELLQKEGSGCAALLNNDMVDDLHRMFVLLSRLPAGLTPMCEIFSSHIKGLGNELIAQRAARLADLPEKERDKDTGGGANDPSFIKNILALHDKYHTMLTTQFSGHGAFQKALKDSFSSIVNSELPGSSVSMPDLLSGFCDRLLKSGGERLTESEAEDFLEKTVQIFSYLTDKDVFSEIYRNQLAKRILNQRSNSDDMERAMVGKLKLRCGAQFTGKMEGMLNDLAVANEGHVDFDRHYKEQVIGAGGPKIDFIVSVLTTGHWPSYRVVHVHLPSPMLQCCEIFSDYYRNKLEKRRLQWSHSLGNALVKGIFNSGRKSYDFQVVTLQAAVMLVFNSKAVWSFVELQEELKLKDEEVLKRVVHSLACGKLKVLKKNPDNSVIKNTDVFSFNEAFTCQMRNVRIPMASLDDNSAPKRIEEDRGFAIEAAAVRIMKSRKVLGHQQLVGEILVQLSFFQPNPRVIKKKLENLIEREYLERDPENPNVYKYLA